MPGVETPGQPYNEWKNAEHPSTIFVATGDVDINGNFQYPRAIRLVYDRMIKPSKRLPDVLLNIIILYLLWEDEWKRSFNWKLQLMRGYE